MKRLYSTATLLAVLAVGTFFITRAKPAESTVSKQTQDAAKADTSSSTPSPSSNSIAPASDAVMTTTTPSTPVARKTIATLPLGEQDVIKDSDVPPTKMALSDIFPDGHLPITNWKQLMPDRITLEPVKGIQIPFEAVSKETGALRNTWIGRNAIQGASLTYCATETMADMVVTLPNGAQYIIHATNAGATVVENFDEHHSCGTQDMKADEITNTPHAPSLADTGTDETLGTASAPNEAATDQAVFICDILVVYSTGSKETWGATPDEVANKYASWCAAANTYYANSLITNLKVNVVGAIEAIGYNSTATTNMVDDLDAIAYASRPSGITLKTSPIFAAVNAKRKEVKADFVQFIVDGTKNCAGIAYVGGSHSAIHKDVSPYTMAHELGHNMGCVHDRQTDSAPDNTTTTGLYNYGFMYNGTISYGSATYSTTTGTIMSYAGTRLPYFSNPNVIYNDANLDIGAVALGAAIDQPKAAYNAKVLTDNAPTNAAKVAGANDPVVSPITSNRQCNNSYAGESITLIEAAEGDKLQYQWYKRRVNNGQDTVTRISNATASTYTIDNFSETDVAAYYVIVWNSNGATKTDETSIFGMDMPVANPPTTSTNITNNNNTSTTTSTSTGTSSTDSTSSTKGGGGAPSDYFLLALASVVLIRKFTVKK